MLPPIFTHLAMIAGFLLAALVIAHMFRQRHSPAATTAWLLAIVLLPTLRVLPATRSFELFGSPVVFFILGAFILAAAMMRSAVMSRRC